MFFKDQSSDRNMVWDYQGQKNEQFTTKLQGLRKCILIILVSRLYKITQTICRWPTYHNNTSIQDLTTRWDVFSKNQSSDRNMIWDYQGQKDGQFTAELQGFVKAYVYFT